MTTQASNSFGRSLWLSSLLLTLFALTTPTHADKTKQKTTKLAPPTFSHESGFYPKPFNLTLSHPNKDVTIYYTLDGSNPDPENLNGKTFRYKNSEIQEKFIARFSDLLNRNFKSKRILSIIKHSHSEIDLDIERHIKRWTDPKSFASWQGYTKDFIRFFEHRPKYQGQEGVTLPKA